MNPRFARLVLPAVIAGASLVAIFAVMLVRYRAELREEIRRTIINRDAAVLRPVALRQLAQHEAATAGPEDLLAAVLESVQQENMVAVVIFDAQGRVLRVAPDSLLFPDLALNDYLRLLKLESISRYHQEFRLDRYFAGAGGAPEQRTTPVLEVLLPLHGREAAQILGFAQYYIDARPLAAELAAIDERVNRQTAATLGVGALLIAAVVTLASLGLSRAQRDIAERNERLLRADFELNLAAKASALGQIASHLIHGLQGSVAGLRAVVAGRAANGAISDDWNAAASYTENMQAMIQETVALLGDTATQGRFELTGHELAGIVRDRNAEIAAKAGVVFAVEGGFERCLDGRRGSLLCLIINNLVQNAIEATDRGRRVRVTFHDGSESVKVTVADEGHGISQELREHLFEPGCTGRPNGTGLGLAISHLLARQIEANLALESTGPGGTVFSLTLHAND